MSVRGRAVCSGVFVNGMAIAVVDRCRSVFGVRMPPSVGQVQADFGNGCF